MLTSPSVVYLSALDLTISILCLSLLLEDCRCSERRVLYLYVCSPSACLSESSSLASAPVRAPLFSLSLFPLRPLVAVTTCYMSSGAFLFTVSWLPRCRSVCVSETVCWLVSWCRWRHSFWFGLTEGPGLYGMYENKNNDDNKK